MLRRPPRSTQSRSSAASEVYKRQVQERAGRARPTDPGVHEGSGLLLRGGGGGRRAAVLSLIHISEPTRPY